MDSQFDVVIVGGGAAGLTAAIGLARARFTVAVVEAAVFPGAENWSGCVYFGENLAHPDILGPEGLEGLAWERRLVERGAFATDGHGLLGITYRDPPAFQHCYTVLRPIFDQHLATLAAGHGAHILAGTTAESLIRDQGRVIGVATHRGPLYADLVFLAEGDASHLVSREGYERFTDSRQSPHFLHGIKQVIDMPPGAIEELFGVGPEEGAAYEFLVRNGSHNGRPLRLNMGGFLYTNRESLSLGLVLPAEHLNEQFEGNPNLLMEWFEQLPALRPWLSRGRRGVFGAKLIRGGGAKEVPRLIDEGLAIGGAASGIGVDFPYPNFTGPATGMGLLLVQAARQIRTEAGVRPVRFTEEALRRHYLEPLQQTHYWRDVHFLRHWPGYVKRTSVFFGPNLDLALGSAYIWTRRRWLPARWLNWLRLIGQIAGPGQWTALREDVRHLIRALNLKQIVGRPMLGRLLLDGTLNALRDLVRKERAHVPAAGTVRVHYTVAGETDQTGRPPGPVVRWFGRLQPIVGAAARRVYANNDEPLQEKLLGAMRLLVRQVNILDLAGAGLVALWAGVCGLFMAGWDRLRALGRKRASQRGIYPLYAHAAQEAGDLTGLQEPAAQAWDGRLGHLAYQTIKASHIHVHWPTTLAGKGAVVEEGLWHVCPARVYEARVNAHDQLQIVVNFENCIKCETCWRTSDRVDWGRDGQHRFVYPVMSSAASRLTMAAESRGQAPSLSPRTPDPWRTAVATLSERLRGDGTRPSNGQDAGDVARLRRFLQQLDQKLAEYDTALAEEPRTIDRPRAEYLTLLAEYAHQLALAAVDGLKSSALADSTHPGRASAYRQMLELATALAARAGERVRRVENRQFAWAAADGRQIRQHHLAGLERYLEVLANHVYPAPLGDPAANWMRAETAAADLAAQQGKWRARLDEVFPPHAWRDLEQQTPLNSQQDAVLRDLLAQVPALNPSDLAGTLHPPLRKVLLAELGRRDPSLAYRAAVHLWARDLAGLAPASSSPAQAAPGWARGDEWASFCIPNATAGPDGHWSGQAVFAPAVAGPAILLLLGDQLTLVPRDWPGLRIEPVSGLGLRGAGLAELRLDGLALPASRVNVDPDRIRRAWRVISGADLAAIALGMADLLCQRAVSHAVSRVQFPGLFHDEEARDTIGKFGAIKKMVAEMGARRYLIETLVYNLGPTDFSSSSVDRAGLVKAVVAEALGTAPGSLAYNAGQIFGGTGYSEDDVLSKYFRDAAAWRYLGSANPEVWRQHGEDLLRGWRPDGQRLATLRDEPELFSTMAQRKALQAELDRVRVLRSGLRNLVTESLQAGGPAPAERAILCEEVARQDGNLLAAKALLLRTHARLESGLPSALEIALVRVWLEEITAGLHLLDANRSPPTDLAGSLPLLPRTFADFLAAPSPYESGDFLAAPVDLARPRLVPEMLAADPELAGRDRALEDAIVAYFGRLRDGQVYERYIERQHRPDEEDLDYCRNQGFFRMPIPRTLGGEGRPKVDYYLLTTHAHRHADVAVSLTIQANTSIGTTPILLARDKDLPRAVKEVSPFVADPALQDEIGKHIEEILQMAQRGDFHHLSASYWKLHEKLHETVVARGALKGVAARFLRAWQKAGRAIQDSQALDVRRHLDDARKLWPDFCRRAAELHSELGRRQEACDLFLRWVASGQISAFALTEPSAGSDTARIATRARLRTVVVEREAGGALRFVPAGGTEPRYLVDARQIDFRPEGVFYRWSLKAEPSRIHFDAYDYETDDPTGQRYYQHGERRQSFTDIAQLRERDGQLWYDYWELTGAKMWITNGRMAGVMCLYAKTDDGVTGFLVDRHAEGLVVGKDEAKMGQCGSPTNELSLQAVRVPRENVLGLEGRGQVNALETLNVGRAGLAISAVAPMPGLISGSLRNAASPARTGPENLSADSWHSSTPGWADWRVKRMREAHYIAEAVAWAVVGRFDHAQTRAVRMESAAAKMLASELLQEVIELAEDCHGLAGQTVRHLVEKRKRDARVLNIYEGTNEIQRFLILKDLVTEVAPRWRKAGRRTDPASPLALARELQDLQGELRRQTDAALAVLDQELWQNPNLQPTGFLLAEAAAWLYAAECAAGRLAWTQGPSDGNGEPTVGLAAFHRCRAEVRGRLRRFADEMAQVRAGAYPAVIRAASLIFARQAADVDVTSRPAAHRVRRPLSILVVASLASMPGSKPQLADGKPLNAHWVLGDADRSALEMALRCKDAGSAVTVEVAAVGPRAAKPALREALSLGVSKARLVVTDAGPVAVDSAAAALATVYRSGPSFDLILGGENGADAEEALLAPLVAGMLNVPHAGAASLLAVQADVDDAAVTLVGPDGRPRVRSLPVAANIEAGLALRPFTVAGYLAGLARPVERLRWPRRVPEQPVFLAPASTAAASSVVKAAGRPLLPAEAAGRLREEIGGEDSAGDDGPPFPGVISDITQLPDAPVLAIVAASADGRLAATGRTTLQAARVLARREGMPATALVLVANDEHIQRQATAQVQSWLAGDVVLLPTGAVDAGAQPREVLSLLVTECLAAALGPVRRVVGEPWTAAAFAALAGHRNTAGRRILRVRQLLLDNERLVLSTDRDRGRGRLAVMQMLPAGSESTYWIAMTADAQIDAGKILTVPSLPASVRVLRWTPRLERFFGRADIQRLVAEWKQETGLVRLADAEFIIDVGFGVGNRDGYEAVIEPLEQALRELGVARLVVGGSRKVTEELHLLPADRQIGQSGESVNPRVLLAIGISGAPQHVNYIGSRATILAFNRDPEAPLMTLNQRQARPRVFPVIGDLFETVPAFIAALRQQSACQPAGAVQASREA